MNSTKPPVSNTANSRPRLRVVIPLLLVCFATTYFVLRDAWKKTSPTISTDLARETLPGVSSEVQEEAGERQRLIATNRFRKVAPSKPLEESATVNDDSPTISAAPTIVGEPVSLRSSPSSVVASSSATKPPGTQITGRILLKGIPPPELNLPLDSSCATLHKTPPKTRFYRVDTNGGLADTFVYITDGVKGSPTRSQLQPVLLDQVGCEYVPYVLGLQTGQKLLVRNSDPVVHNVHPTPIVRGNKELNTMQRPGAANLQFIFNQPEVFLRLRCDVHSWMFAYVGVVNHRFFAVSGSDGTFAIPDVPAGSYTVEAYHRKAGRALQVIQVNEGERTDVEFTFELPAAADSSNYKPQMGSVNRTQN